MKYIDIISGFLGAGKTTLIKKIVAALGEGTTTAIIENEYGEVGIDGSLLKSKDLNIKEVTSGCICCSIEDDFKDALKEIMNTYNPNRIIIEPSGVAKLPQVIREVKEVTRDSGYSINMVITVVDALNFEMYLDNFEKFFMSQISFAKTVLLTKTDVISNDEVLQVFKGVRKLNPNCPIITTPLSKIDGKKIISVAEFGNDEIFNGYDNLKRSLNVTRVVKHNHCCDATSFDSWGIETPKVFTTSEIKNSLDKLANHNYGNVIRAKGIVNTSNSWVQFDYVSGKIDIKKIDYDYTGRICVIGTRLKKKEISSLFLGE